MKPIIDWDLSGPEIEAASFRRIEEEMGPHTFSLPEWHVVRRMIHTCADFTIVEDVTFANDPIAAIHDAVKGRAPVYCDSNMIRSGVSLARLRNLNADYASDDVRCYVADPPVAEQARARGVARSLLAVEKARSWLAGAIVLIGNAPLALAALARMIEEDGIRPAAVIGLPVGFVHVLESKQMIMDTDVPQIVLRGRRGGSPLAVAALHGALENPDG